MSHELLHHSPPCSSPEDEDKEEKEEIVVEPPTEIEVQIEIEIEDIVMTDLKPAQSTAGQLSDFPNEIQSSIISFLQQDDLVTMCLVSKLFYNLATQFLYRRIYLNDSFIETSRLNHLYLLAPNWSWFKLKRDHSIDETKEDANDKLKLLVRTLRENLLLNNKIYELRLNWDLEIDLQLDLLKVVADNSQSVRIIENITDPKMNSEGLQKSKYSSNITSLELPPPQALPTMEVPDRSYLMDLTKHLTMNLTRHLRHLTLFIDPLLMFNNVVRPKFKLELNSFKYHCRQDLYPRSVYKKEEWLHHKLSDIFDVRYLKNLTIISWHDSMPNQEIFRFADWSDFVNLEDITLIAVVFNDRLIAKMIRSCKKLRRLKLDFGNLMVLPNTRVYKAIMSPPVMQNLEFLDMKLYIPKKIFDLDLRTYEVEAKKFCSCLDCNATYAEVLRAKVIPTGRDFMSKAGRDFYYQVNFFYHFAHASLLPYSKAVDKYPSVRTSDDNVEQFVDYFNGLNGGRSDFTDITVDDFYRLFQYYIHSWKSELLPFIQFFEKLKFIVINDVAMIIVNSDNNTRVPLTLFHNRNFKSNF